MKIKLFATGCIVSLMTFVSCKDDKKTDNQVIEEPVNTFEVTLDVNLKKNDTLHLYYTEDNSINFTEENSLWVSAEGKEQNQNVVFKLPVDVFPSQFRLDMGVNPENERIVLNGITFSYAGQTSTIRDSLIYNYFRPDESVTVLDKKTNTLSRKDPKATRGPSLYPHEANVAMEMDKFKK